MRLDLVTTPMALEPSLAIPKSSTEFAIDGNHRHRPLASRRSSKVEHSGLRIFLGGGQRSIPREDGWGRALPRIPRLARILYAWILAEEPGKDGSHA